MKKIALFIFAALVLTNAGFAQPNEQQLKDYITESCADDQECACAISYVAPHLGSIEAIERINRGKGSAQEIKIVNNLIVDINTQCGTELEPIVVE